MSKIMTNRPIIGLKVGRSKNPTPIDYHCHRRTQYHQDVKCVCLHLGGTNCKALRFYTDASRKGVPHVKHSFTRYPDSDVAWQCSGLALQPLLGICSKWHHDHSTHRGHRGSRYGTDLIKRRPTRLTAVGSLFNDSKRYIAANRKLPLVWELSVLVNVMFLSP